MKKQDILIFISALIMMISFSALSYGQELTLNGYEVKEYQSEYEKIIDIGFMGEDIKSFRTALQEGNLKAVKYLAASGR